MSSAETALTSVSERRCWFTERIWPARSPSTRTPLSMSGDGRITTFSRSGDVRETVTATVSDWNPMYWIATRWVPADTGKPELPCPVADRQAVGTYQRDFGVRNRVAVRRGDAPCDHDTRLRRSRSGGGDQRQAPHGRESRACTRARVRHVLPPVPVCETGSFNPNVADGARRNDGDSTAQRFG